MSKNETSIPDRTHLAEDRTILANERTFAGWMRTGMAAVALALGLRAVFRPFEPTWIPKLVSTVFIVAALMIFVAAWRNACQAHARMDEHSTESQSPRRMSLITSVLSLGAVSTGAVLWLL